MLLFGKARSGTPRARFADYVCLLIKISLGKATATGAFAPGEGRGEGRSVEGRVSRDEGRGSRERVEGRGADVEAVSRWTRKA